MYTLCIHILESYCKKKFFSDKYSNLVNIAIIQDEIDKTLKKDKETGDEDDEDEEFIKRRGKKRRKRGRDASRGPPAFQPSIDPETQVK